MASTDVVMGDNMDIDFGDEDPVIAELNAQAAAINNRTEAEAADAMKDVEEVTEEGEFDPTETQPTKVHVRGVDRLNTNQIEIWVGEHAGTDLFKKVEWIDDNSANLIFDTEFAATDALNTLSAVEGSEPLELRKAKEPSSSPDHVLEVRLALVTDVKTKGAKDRSAFYLFNPEWDPDNPNNVRRDTRKRRWADDGGRERNKYRRREWEDDRLHRRGSTDQGNFTEDMYDEGAAAAPAPQDNRRASSGSEYSRRKVTFDDDLFASKQNGRLRDRSASPGRDGDGRFGFSEEQPRRRTARPRSATPPGIRKNRENRSVRDGVRKDLFADKPPASALSNGYGHFSDRPSTPTSSGGVRELMPAKGTPNHQRQGGRDLPLEDVVELMGKSKMEDDHYAAQHTYGSNHFLGARPSAQRSSQAAKGGDLFARTSSSSSGDLFARASSGRDDGRLNRSGNDDHGISIKGIARNGGGGGGGNGTMKFGAAASDQGFNFLGASSASRESQGQQRTENLLVKELFPRKKDLFDGVGSGKKDLFDGRIKGRASGRRRAEDLF